MFTKNPKTPIEGLLKSLNPEPRPSLIRPFDNENFDTSSFSVFSISISVGDP